MMKRYKSHELVKIAALKLLFVNNITKTTNFEIHVCQNSDTKTCRTKSFLDKFR